MSIAIGMYLLFIQYPMMKHAKKKEGGLKGFGCLCGKLEPHHPLLGEKNGNK
jgi:hypothetical protein